MSLAVVTSFSAKGWNDYGERFVKTFNHFWPIEVELHVVSEDPFEPLEAEGRLVKIWSFEEDPQAKLFYETYRDQKWCHGDAGAPRPDWLPPNWPQQRGYCFRHDAYKFSKKVFALALVAERIQPQPLLWLDADVITFAQVPSALINKLLPPGFLISYLPRAHNYYSECGFVGYDLRSPEVRDFIKAFVGLYTSREIFKHKQWHDCWAFDLMRKETKINAYPLPHGSNHHPFINSVLGSYMDHLKGDRKKQGRSHPAEQLHHGGLDYWRSRRT